MVMGNYVENNQNELLRNILKELKEIKEHIVKIY